MRQAVRELGAHLSLRPLRFLLPPLLLLCLQVQAAHEWAAFLELASPVVGVAVRPAAGAASRGISADSNRPSLLWDETSSAGFVGGMATSRLTSSTPLCAAYATAPADAQSLSAGTHTFFVTGSTSGTIWGAGTYTDDSRIAAAAVHDGRVAVGAKAIIRLTKSGGLSSYTGSTKNGVTSRSYGPWTGSYTLAFVSACSTAPPPKPATTTPSCSSQTAAPVNASSLANGTYTYLVTGSSLGTVWGTGTYTDDSRIAKAAVHDGHVAVGAKAVIRLTKSGGLSSYTGSTKNGITTSSYGSWTGSYTLALVGACSTTPAPNPKPDPPATPPTTPPAKDTDGDGVADSEDTDDDNDGMSDVCETTHGFNPLNASDGGSTDTDNDGISNVAECRNGTDPKTRTSLVDKGIPMVGFDYEYKVYGKMNSNDLYVARDPGAAGVPGVAGFYLRVNTDDDEPQYYNLVHPISRADAAKDGFTESTNHGIKLRDLNGDGAQDAVITGLEDSALGRWDVIVYTSTTTNTSPLGYREIDKDFKNFFSELGAWLLDGDYFHDNAGVRASVPKISGYSFASRNGLLYFGPGPMPRNQRPAQCGLINTHCVDALVDSDFVNDPNILYSLTPFRAFVADEEDDPALRNGYILVVVFFSITEKFDIPDYSGFTSAHKISPAIKSVIETGKLVAGSVVERTISDILAAVFGGVNVIPATVTGSTADEQGEARAGFMWWLLVEWLSQGQINRSTQDVKGNAALDAFMVRELKLLQTQGRLTAGNNEWVFVVDKVNGSLMKKNLKQGPNDYQVMPSYAGVMDLQAVGHSHPSSGVANDPTVAAVYRPYIGDIETACRELPGPHDHLTPLGSPKVPNYYLTPSGAVRVVEVINYRIVVRTVSGTDYPGQTILTSNYPQAEATGNIGRGTVKIPQQSDFFPGAVAPCNHGKLPTPR